MRSLQGGLTPSGGPGRLPRAAAGTAALCAVAHLVGLTAAPVPAGAAVVPLALAAGCLGCAVHLWHRAGLRAWAAHAALAVAMLLVHPLPAGRAMAGMAHGTAAGPLAGLAGLSVTGGAVAGLALAATAATLALARRRGAQEGTTRAGGSAVSASWGRVPQA